MARQFGRSPQDSGGNDAGKRFRQNSQQNQYRQAGLSGGGLGLRVVSGSISLLFLLLIILEIAGFIWVADHIGLGLTLLAVLASAFLGLWLIKRTGLDMIAKLRLTLGQGQEPGHSLVDGACFVIAGLLLILPGFFSDILALLLILPMTRNWFIRYLARKFGADFRYTSTTRSSTTVIDDAEFHEVRDTAPPSEGDTAPRSEGGQNGEPGGAEDRETGRETGPSFIEVLPPADHQAGARQSKPGADGPGLSASGRPIIDVDETDAGDKKD